MFSISQLSKYYGGRPVFENVSLTVAPGERVGVIGRNGAGKTTLLRCLCGLEEPDEGRIYRPKGWRIAYLSQREFEDRGDAFWSTAGSDPAIDSEDGVGAVNSPAPAADRVSGEETVESAALKVFAKLEEAERRLRLLEAELGAADGDHDRRLAVYGAALEEFERMGGYDYRFRTRAVLSGLGFDETQWQQPVSTLSGGERVRLALARVLLAEPELVLLDEPTNHLDMDAVEWLEGFLQRFPGSLIIVSHDRTFLDRVTQRTWEVAGGAVTDYRGSYSHAMRQKEEALRRLQKERAAQQRERARLEAFIARFRAGTRASQAQDRLKKLERLQPLPQLPVEKPRQLRLSLGGARAHAYGQTVCAVKDLQMAYQGQPVFGPLNVQLRAGERVALTGPNGAGKSTLLRLLLGELVPQAGTIQWAEGTQIGYFAQHRHELSPRATVLETLLAHHPMPEREARDLLASFFFTGSQVDQAVGTLSGGEQSRLSLLLLMLSPVNVLLLDEPTNHLDLPSRAALEEALEAFDGTLVVVSHDRYFLDRVTNVTWELRDGRLYVWEGRFLDAREQMKLSRGLPPQDEAPRPTARDEQRAREKGRSPGQVGGQERRWEQKGSAATRAAVRAFRALEEQIAQLENEKEALGRRLADPALYQQDEGEAARVVARYRELEGRLEELYREWETQAQALEGVL